MKFMLQNVSEIAEVPDIIIEQFPFVIGRGGDSNAQLPLAFISRRHCRLTASTDGVLVQDLESHNGTFVNGRKALSPLTVNNGDEVSLGSMCFRAILTSAAQETAQGMAGITLEEVNLPADQPANGDRTI
ncbi:MAG: FHA domain-containing protein [Gemmataceae bacterium]